MNVRVEILFKYIEVHSESVFSKKNGTLKSGVLLHIFNFIKIKHNPFFPPDYYD